MLLTSALGVKACCACVWGSYCFFFQAEDGIRDSSVTGVQTCALPISSDYYSYGYNPGAYDNGDRGYYGSGAYDSSDQYTDRTIADVQTQLAREGYYRGDIDGVLGPETRRAIVSFQSDHGLRETGNLMRETLSTLGL